MTDLIGTAQERELIEWLRRSAEASTGDGSKPRSTNTYLQAADALESRIAEVGRLTERVRELEVVVEAAAYAMRNNGYPETAAKIEDEFLQRRV